MMPVHDARLETDIYFSFLRDERYRVPSMCYLNFEDGYTVRKNKDNAIRSP